MGGVHWVIFLKAQFLSFKYFMEFLLYCVLIFYLQRGSITTQSVPNKTKIGKSGI